MSVNSHSCQNTSLITAVEENAFWTSWDFVAVLHLATRTNWHQSWLTIQLHYYIHWYTITLKTQTLFVFVDLDFFLMYLFLHSQFITALLPSVLWAVWLVVHNLILRLYYSSTVQKYTMILTIQQHLTSFKSTVTWHESMRTTTTVKYKQTTKITLWISFTYHSENTHTLKSIIYS